MEKIYIRKQNFYFVMKTKRLLCDFRFLIGGNRIGKEEKFEERIRKIPEIENCWKTIIVLIWLVVHKKMKSDFIKIGGDWKLNPIKVA